MNLTPEQNLFLASSEAFQAILNDDPVLTELDAAWIDMEAERLMLFEALGATERICGIEVQPITPAVWSVLWTLKSPLCSRSMAGATALDAAIALWLLTHPLGDFSYETIEEDAAEYSRTIAADWSDIWMELAAMVNQAFSPLKMLPQTGGNSEMIFDADWMLSLCSVAARESGVSLQFAANNYPLSRVHGLVVICARKANPGSCYEKHMPEYIGKKTLERIDELAADFLKKNPAPEPPERTNEEENACDR